MPKKGQYGRFQNCERKDLKSFLMTEDNRNQNPDESYTNKYQKHVACSYGYQLVCADDKFSKLFKSYLGEDVVYTFIDDMVEESKYFNDAMKNHFNKELVKTKKHVEDFENSTKCWICDNAYVDNDVKERNPCHWKKKGLCR